jgi:deoxycytidylate deaminase
MTTARQSITALIYDRKGRLLTVGRNSYHKTHPLQARAAQAVGLDEKIYLHAEIDALVRLRDWRRAHRMVITRYTRDGQPALARPCPVCARVINQAGIKIIEHT